MFQAQALRLTLMTFGRKKETCLIHCNENTAILKIAFKFQGRLLPVLRLELF